MIGWGDLRRRLENEPLIFVKVALVKGITGNVQELLAKPDTVAADAAVTTSSDPHADFNTAIFYSSSNCQDGLKGISFGNFLIKQVVAELKREFEQLEQFATLSPIPGFRRWLDKERGLADSPVIDDAARERLQIGYAQLDQ